MVRHAAAATATATTAREFEAHASTSGRRRRRCSSLQLELEPECDSRSSACGVGAGHQQHSSRASRHRLVRARRLPQRGTRRPLQRAHRLTLPLCSPVHCCVQANTSALSCCRSLAEYPFRGFMSISSTLVLNVKIARCERARARDEQARTRSTRPSRHRRAAGKQGTTAHPSAIELLRARRVDARCDCAARCDPTHNARSHLAVGAERDSGPLAARRAALVKWPLKIGSPAVSHVSRSHVLSTQSPFCSRVS